MYRKRQIAKIYKSASAQFPCVVVTGPRQAGKSTFLLNEAAIHSKYISFDDTLERQFAVADPNGFLDRFEKDSVILDEIQYVPELLPYVKIRIDSERERYGRWILTGSQQFHLMKNVSESLAGRAAVLDLLPFSLNEIAGNRSPELQTVIWYGSYPEPALNHGKRELWLRSYLQTYVERDVRQLQNIKDLRAFELFLELGCARHSAIFNSAEFARTVGITLPTAKAWLGVLEASYLVYLLKPFYNNLGKRISKSPKLYIIDPAIVCYLTRQPSAEAALSGAMGGALFEGLVVSELLKAFTNRGRKPDMWYWRSHDGLEVDVIIQGRGKLIPMEIKLTATPGISHCSSLKRFGHLAGEKKTEPGVIVCRVSKRQELPHGMAALPWQDLPDWISHVLD